MLPPPRGSAERTIPNRRPSTTRKDADASPARAAGGGAVGGRRSRGTSPGSPARQGPRWGPAPEAPATSAPRPPPSAAPTSRSGDGGRRRAHSSRPLPLRKSAPPRFARHRAHASFQLPFGKSPAPLFRHPPPVSSPRRSGRWPGSSVRRDFGGSGHSARRAGRAPRGAPRHRLPPRRPAARRPRWGRAPGCGSTQLSRRPGGWWSRVPGVQAPSSITGEILPRF